MKHLLTIAAFFLLACTAQAQDATRLDLTCRAGARFNYTFQDAATDFSLKDSIDFVVLDLAGTELASYDCADSEVTCADGSVTIAIVPTSTGYPSTAASYRWNLRVFESGAGFYDAWLAGAFTMKAANDLGATSSGGTTTLTVTTGTTATITITAVSSATTFAAEAVTGLTLATPVSGDHVAFYDASASALRKADFDDFGGAGSGDSGFVNGTAATNMNFVDGTDVTFTLTTGPSPDEIDIFVVDDGHNHTTTTISGLLAADMGDADHGDVSWSSGVATVENLQCTGCVADAELASTFLKNLDEDATPALSGDLEINANSFIDTIGNEQLGFAQTIAAANYLEVANASAGNPPTLSAIGDDAAVSLNLVPKGAGVVQAGGVEVATISGAQTFTNKSISGDQIDSGTIPAARVGADHVDTITEIAAALKSGADGTLITGTAGAAGNCAEFDANGDVIDSGSGCGGGSGDNISVNGSALVDANFTDSTEIAFVINRTASPDEISPYIVGMAAAKITDQNAGTDITADLEEEGVTCTGCIDATDMGDGAVGESELIEAMNFTATGTWSFQDNATGANGAYDAMFGDTGTPDYGAIQIGRIGIYSSSFSASGLDIGGAFLLRSEANLDVGNDPGIEFVGMEGGNTVRFMIPESASGNATNFFRSFMIGGAYSQVTGNDHVLCDTHTTFDSNIDCDTGATGADMFVQDDFELEGSIFVSGGDIQLDSDDANSLTINSANITADRTFTFPDDEIALGDLVVGSGAGTFVYTPKSAINLSDFNDDLTHTTEVNDLEGADPSTILDTEIYVGNGAGSGTFVAVSGDGSLANTGALTISDDSHNHVIANVDAFTSSAFAGQISDESGTGLVTMGTGATHTTPLVSGKIDADAGAVNDDDCTGEQGLFWYDDTDSAFEFCNANSGAPTELGGGGTATAKVDYEAEGFTRPSSTTCGEVSAGQINSGPTVYTMVCTQAATSTFEGDFTHPDYQGGTLTFTLVALNSNALPSGEMDFDFSCMARGDGDIVNSTWGTPQNASITFTTQYDQEEAASAAVTCEANGGSAAAGDRIYWRAVMDNVASDTQLTDTGILALIIEEN